MKNPDSSRRQFLKATAGGLIVSASLTSPDTRAADTAESTRVANPVSGDVLQTHGSISADGKQFLEQQRTLPVAGKTDVLVCGGGPAGISAALAAARVGVSVQLIEVAGCLGGVWTVGLLTKVLDSENKSGIMAELLKKFSSCGSEVARKTNGTVYDPEIAKLVLEELCVEAGVKIRLHTRLVGAVTDESNRVVAVLTESKSGREAWLADRFVDCSGDGDLAAHTGCRFDVGIGSDCACQPMSMLALLTGVDPDAIRPFIRETGPSAKTRFLKLMEDHGVNLRPMVMLFGNINTTTTPHTIPSKWPRYVKLQPLQNSDQICINGMRNKHHKARTFISPQRINQLAAYLGFRMSPIITVIGNTTI